MGKIHSWIDESDAFVLILGGRYGSIEPSSGKSYVQLEYEYALENKKPLFSLVISKEHHEQRVKQCGLVVDEREHPESYRKFREKVTERLCRFWADKKDIQAAIFQKLPEWAQRPDLVGWIKADEAPSTEVTNELARLSQENRDLRAKLSVQTDDFHGLTFEETVSMLREDLIPDEPEYSYYARDSGSVKKGPFRHAGELFEAVQQDLAANGIVIDLTGNQTTMEILNKLVSIGLVSYTSNDVRSRRDYGLTEEGRRFRNRMLTAGNREQRQDRFWTI